MKRNFRFISLLLCLVLLFSSCGSDEADKGEEKENDEVTAVKAEDLLEDEDFVSDYDEKGSVIIELKGDSITSSSDSVKIAGTTATITEEASYIISGTLDDGMIVVDAGEKDKPQLIFDGALVTSKSSAALYILEADKVTVTLAENSENMLANKGGFSAIDDNNIDAAIFSKKDMTFNGDGALKIESPQGHGIAAKDDLIMTGGSYSIISASHALDVNDSVRISGAALTLKAGKDGIHCENTEDAERGYIYIEKGTFDISAEGDGISSSNYTQIDDGFFSIISGGGSVNAEKNTSEDWGMYGGGFGGKGAQGGYGKPDFQYSAADTTSSDDSSVSIKGIKAGGNLIIQGGEFTLDCADDALHSNSSISVSAGSFEIKSGDDALHADADLTITEGEIDISESYEGIEALNINIRGGNITLCATDDGLNAAGGNDESGYTGPRGDMFGGSGGSIVISGGILTMSAEGDGIDSNGSLEITGGSILLDTPTYGDTSTLDYTTKGSISGGSFIGTGGTGMNMCFDSGSTQGVIMIGAAGDIGTEITLCDADKNVIISHSAKREFTSVLLSSEKIVKGETYTLTIGGESQDITMTSLIYNTVGSAGGMGGMGGGMHGGPRPGGMKPGARPF